MLTNMGILKGVNLGGWLSQCDYSHDRIYHFIEEKDIATIASWGLDHVRIPVDYNVLEDDQGNYKEEGFQRIDWALDTCRKYGLKVVLDLHKTYGFCFDKNVAESGFFETEAYQERFYRLWEEFARRYGALHDRVVFELLNEVSVPDPAMWNRVVEACIRRIRAIAPETLILVGGIGYNSPAAVKDLDAPQDSKVLYNFHCYDPFAYTHQGAAWVEEMDKSLRISFAQSGCTEALFEDHFASAIESAAANSTSLYCGEYGVIDIVDPADALHWFKTIHAVLDRHRIPRAVWTYKAMDFGISDARWDACREELIKYL